MFVACTERQGYRMALSHARDIMEESPDSSLVILDSLGRHVNEFDRHFRMQYLLSLTYAQAKTGVLFKTDSLTKVLVGYFDDNGSREERTLAYYLHGCALSDIGQAPEALQTYYEAIDIADTTETDCCYNILRGIYGQMSRIFHQQNLPHDEIWALKHYIEYVRRTSSEEDYVIAKGQMIRPYYLLGEKDTVLKIISDKYQSLKRLGNNEKAVSSLGTAIHIYTERGQLQEAKEAMDIFEHESGLFDNSGNIVRGREGYYFTKGFFELASNHIDTAEYYFRKAIRYGYLSEGYKGLLNVYRERNVMDSVLLFSELYEAAQDSLHNKMQIETIHQMSSLYNYSRSQKEAEIERDNARRNRWLAIFTVLVAVILIGTLSWFYRENLKRRKRRMMELERDLNSAINTRNEIMEELQQLKAQDYESVISVKEEKLVELSKLIEKLKAENEAYKDVAMSKEKDNLDLFLESSIATLFVKKATGKTERVIPTEAEWKLLVSQFSKDNPTTYKSFGSGKALPKLEQRICILLVLDIPEYVIAIMTDSSASTVSNSKARANEKLFGKKDAHPLKINLFHALKAS